MNTSPLKKPPEKNIFIGLISGTSMDGVDVVAGDFSDGGIQVVYSQTFPYPDWLKKMLEHIVFSGGSAEDVSRANFAVGDFFGRCAKKCLDAVGEVRAVGSHGQTIFHSPQKKGRLPGATLQIGEPWRIVQWTGLPVYYDFRSYFVAMGKNGAPLAHILHEKLFPSKTPVGVLNIGGIANITLIKGGKTELSFDAGPGIGIVDEGVKLITHNRESIDKEGKFSTRGKVNTRALNFALKNSYFRKKPPKSTGKETFGRAFIIELLEKYPSLKKDPSTFIRTLVEITVQSIADAIRKYTPGIEVLILCGGGRKHPVLVRRLRELLPQVKVVLSEQYGIDGDYIEGLLIAYLTYLAWHGVYPAKLASPVLKEHNLSALYIP